MALAWLVAKQIAMVVGMVCPLNSYCIIRLIYSGKTNFCLNKSYQFIAINIIRVKKLKVKKMEFTFWPPCML